MNRFLATPFALLLASAVVSAPCLAQPIGDGVWLVQFDDLDLATPSGMAAVVSRIRRGVDWVCLDPASSGPVAEVNTACRKRAMKDALAQLAHVLAERRATTALIGLELSRTANDHAR